MTQEITIDMLVAEVPGLSAPRMRRFLTAGIVVPVQRAGAQDVFRPIDRARLTLACELADAFDLQDEALGMVLGLVDQMQGLRGELRALMQAVEAEPADARERITARLREIRAGR